MSSDLKVTNIKHSSSGSNNLVLASDGSATIANATLSAGTLGSSVVNNISVIGFSGRLENELTGNGDRWTWNTSSNYFANGVTVATSGTDDGKITILTAGKYLMILSVSATKVAGDINHFVTGKINKGGSTIAETVAMGFNSTGAGDQRIGGTANIIADLSASDVIDITMGESGDCKTYNDIGSRFSMFRLGA